MGKFTVVHTPDQPRKPTPTSVGSAIPAFMCDLIYVSTAELEVSCPQSYKGPYQADSHAYRRPSDPPAGTGFYKAAHDT